MESNPRLTKPQYAQPRRSSHHHGSDDDHDDDDDDLLPGLPNHIAELCLSRSNPSHLYPVCQSWRRLLYSNSFPPFLSLYAILSSSKPDDQQQKLANPSISLLSLDPFSNTWKPLPPPPPPLRLLHSHPAFLGRKFPIQSLAVSGRLVLLAATSRRLLPALSAPLVFHPASATWQRGPPLPEPRRWCAAGAAGGSLYVASGVGRGYKGDVARSVERWHVTRQEGTWEWEKKAGLRDGRFCREAVEAVEYKGKLCMVNVKGSGPKEGAVYDVAGDKWEAMAAGMVAGWNGPTAASAAVGDDGEESLYTVDEKRGVLSKYEGGEDKWEVVVEAAELCGAEQMSAGGGRVSVVCGGGERIAVVDVAARPPRVWTVELPLPLPVVAVHILPRMSSTYC